MKPAPMEEKINEYLNTHSEVDGILRRMWRHIFAWCRRKNERISIPRDLKIVGYDGNEITRLVSPQVTTIAQNTKISRNM